MVVHIKQVSEIIVYIFKSVKSGEDFNAEVECRKRFIYLY